MSFFLQILFITLGFLMILKPAFANSPCEPIYGGGSTCNHPSMIVQKTVLNPQTGAYVHDLGLVDNKFMPGDKVTFQITVTNTGNQEINQIEVSDMFPLHMTFVSSSIPNARPTTPQSPSFDLGTLFPGQSKSFLITTVLDTADKLGNSGDTCLINQAKVIAPNVNEADDSSQMCVFHPQVFSEPIPSSTPAIPNTGPDIISYVLLPTTGAIGLMLRKFDHRKKEKNIHV